MKIQLTVDIWLHNFCADNLYKYVYASSIRDEALPLVWKSVIVLKSNEVEVGPKAPAFAGFPGFWARLDLVLCI